jgi:hypothetical protein
MSLANRSSLRSTRKLLAAWYLRNLATSDPSDYSPFEDQENFLLGVFLYRKVEMPNRDTDYLIETWRSKLQNYGDSPLFSNFKGLAHLN